MATARDSFVDLERHRQLLEENVKKLSKALDHWKQWRTEYETLRAEVKGLPPAASRQELRSTREKFHSELYHEVLNEKELVDIFGRDDSKKPEQIISTLTNRLDYVGKNIDTLTKQLEEAENRLAAVTVVANPDATDEEGLPITEIMEELDDDDNVISYSLRRPGDSQPQLLEALKKAGITDFSPRSNTAVPEGSQDTPSDESKLLKDAPALSAQLPENSYDDVSESSKKIPDPPNKQPQESKVEAPKKTKPVTKKKSVTFSEDTKPAKQNEQSETAKRLEEILQKAKDQQSIISDPIFPADESQEDRELREHMIRYNKDTMEYEMGPIVAEIQMEEGSTGGDTDDYDDDEDDDEENEWGRSKIDLDDDWKRQMLELKERLSNYDFEENTSDDEEEIVEGMGRITIRREGGEISVSNAGSEPGAEPVAEPVAEPIAGSIIKDSIPAEDISKKVRFAQNLDIAESPAPAPEVSKPKPPKRAVVDPFSDVVERSSGTSQPVTNSTTHPKRVSRFRKGRTDPPINTNPVALDGTPILPEMPSSYGQSIPSGPEGRTLANSVLEHEPSSKVKEPDEFDADLLQKQVVEDYNKKRNQFIHRQGGFMKEDENPIQPLDEEDGGPKRMSRFKAARLGQI
ncbi:Prefoldin subunit-domain-containing protein [Hypoxylon rubiginosum]|uniref:Prefoldin subunit-domain-containing protein n=1 Tax=Hypoxylon rubiginosum TaxID=110542 RepID=A0ACB9ZE07_9PEZI|nr:Prefoldin subunit-domain-containing protein [Hypoxylon rubiginosum]